MEVREDDEEFKNPVDLMFDVLEAEKPNHFAVRQYKKYKLAAGKQPSRFLFLVVRALQCSTLQSCVRSRPMMSWSWTLWETGKLPCSSS